MGRCIGIDLGTTNSVVAIVEMGGCKVLLNREYEQQTRSIVNFNKGEFLVGKPALNRWELAPKDTVISIKRLIGRAISDPKVDEVRQNQWVLYDIVEPSDGTSDSVRVKLGDKEYSPIEISAMILRKLKEDAEYFLKEEVTHAVITAPAYFSEKQCNATREAGLKAGLTVMRILDEPTAAALAFGIDSKGREPKTILVYDLGGGTFDVSILLMGAGSFAPLNLQGDMWLGGDNFDQAIIDYVVSYVKREYSIDPTTNKRFMVRLKLRAQEAKEALSSARVTELVVDGLLRDDKGNIIDVVVEITREQFEDMIRPLVERTISICKRAIENANLSFNDIDYVLMVGNATCVPLVQEAVERLFGKEKVLRTVHPKNSVAIGAAIYAATSQHTYCYGCSTWNELEVEKCKKCDAPLSPIRVGSIVPFHFGVQTAGDKFNIFIRKGETYPTPEEKRIIQTFYTQFPNQRIVSIPVYGGEEIDVASKNIKQGEAFAILPPHCPQGTCVLIKLWLDENKNFNITAKLENGRELNPWILRGDLDQKAVEILHKSVETIAKEGDALTLTEKKEVEKLHNEVLDAIQKKEFERAEKKVEEVLKLVENAVKKGDPLMEQAEGIIGYAKYIVNNYGWLIGSDAAYILNNLIGNLQEAIDKKERTLVENKINELNTEIEKLMETRDFSGKSEPTLLAIFMIMHGRIMSDIQPVEPAKANNLRQKLLDIEHAFINGHRDATDKLNAFVSEFISVIEEIEKRPGAKGTKVCMVCGHENPSGTRYCESCKADLYLLSHERISTPFTGKIQRW